MLFPDQAAGAAQRSMSAAVQQGAAWRLDGVELMVSPPPCEQQLSIRRGSPKAGCPAGSRPGTAEDRKDFGWVADLNRIVPGLGIVDPALLGPQPPGNRIAGRLRLRSGVGSAYRLVTVGGQVPALDFRSLRGQEAAAGCSQALADWVVAEIQMSGDSVELQGIPWGEGKRRSVKLVPENGLVDVVVLNVATAHFDLPAGERPAAPGPGKHFELYYELTRSKPSVLPVPHLPDLSKTAMPPVPKSCDRTSALLEALGLGDSRTVYDRLICPLAQLTAGEGP
jgi:hypothetical protein